MYADDTHNTFCHRYLIYRLTDFSEPFCVVRIYTSKKKILNMIYSINVILTRSINAP